MIPTTIILALTLAGAAPVETAGLEAGVAVVDITPDGRKVLDPLKVKALVLRQGKLEAALAVCDVIGISAQQAGEARRLASQRTGIPVSRISVSATHTHTGGYHPELTERIATAIADARGSVRPVTLRAGVIEQHGLSFNRRFLMKDGTVRFNPGPLEGGASFDGGHPYQNPDIVRPVGPIDPQVGLLLFSDAAGAPVASLTNFALHVVTTDGRGISADYPFFYETALRRQLGDPFVSVFATGPCGDINHWDVSKPGPQNHYEKFTQPIGEKLAATALAGLPRLESVPAASLDVRSQTVAVPLRDYSEMDLAWAKEAVANKFQDFPGAGYNQRGFLAGVRARSILRLEELRKNGPRLPLEVQAFRVSDKVAIVTLPGEIFVELGLAIKKASPFPTTLVIELANASCAYVPTMKAFAEGGYEVVNSVVAPGGGELLAETAIKLLKQLE
jgi:neutral ceramidase